MPFYRSCPAACSAPNQLSCTRGETCYANVGFLERRSSTNFALVFVRLCNSYQPRRCCGNRNSRWDGHTFALGRVSKSCRQSVELGVQDRPYKVCKSFKMQRLFFGPSLAIPQYVWEGYSMTVLILASAVLVVFVISLTTPSLSKRPRP